MAEEHRHRVEPQQVEDMLEAEFGGSIPREERSAAAHDAVHAFDDARIGVFVPILAWRRARERVRARLRGSS